MSQHNRQPYIMNVNGTEIDVFDAHTANIQYARIAGNSLWIERRWQEYEIVRYAKMMEQRRIGTI